MNGGIVGGTIGVGGVAGGPQNFPFAAQRRAQLAQQGLGGMGGMRPPGKSGLSFDVILSRLQGELQKSRETGAELNSLNGAMNEIHDTLGGTLVCLQHLFSISCLIDYGIHSLLPSPCSLVRYRLYGLRKKHPLLQ